jgi:hypothetical protein
VGRLPRLPSLPPSAAWTGHLHSRVVLCLGTAAPLDAPSAGVASADAVGREGPESQTERAAISLPRDDVWVSAVPGTLLSGVVGWPRAAATDSVPLALSRVLPQTGAATCAGGGGADGGGVVDAGTMGLKAMLTPGSTGGGADTDEASWKQRMKSKFSFKKTGA